MTVDAIIDGVIRREGGYVDHPADAGGPTNYGITQAVARQSGYTGDLRAMPKSVAAAIYRVRYVDAPKFDAVVNLAPKLGEKLIDTGVNMGPATAVRFLQRGLNALALDGKAYARVTVDGVNGQRTLAALAAYLRVRPGGEGVLVTAVAALQGARYIELVEQRPANAAFAYGWLSNRVVLK